jgi:ABC-type uncharacterized transport system permease subunit
MSPTNFSLINIFIIGNFMSTIYGLYKDEKISKHIFVAGLAYLVYIITWIPAIIIGAVNRDKKQWYHTPHKNLEKPGKRET